MKRRGNFRRRQSLPVIETKRGEILKCKSKYNPLVCGALTVVMAFSLSLCSAQSAYASESIPDGFVEMAEITEEPAADIPEESAVESPGELLDSAYAEETIPDSALESGETSEELIADSSEESTVEVPKEQPEIVKPEKKPAKAKKKLKPAVFQTVAEVVAEEEKPSSEEAKPAVESSVSASSSSPVLTLLKEQAVNGGKRTKETLKTRPGDTVTYYLAVTNAEESERPAKAISIMDGIPDGMVYVENSATAGATLKDGSIRWDIDDLAAGETFAVSYQAKIPEDSGAATYSGTANASCHIESMMKSPKTADENHPAVWLAVAGISLAAMLGGAVEALNLKRHE